MNPLILILVFIAGQSFGQFDFGGNGLDTQWMSYKANFNKSYSNPLEDARKKQNFANNLLTIAKVNNDYGDGYLTINEFSDYDAKDRMTLTNGVFTIDEKETKSMDYSTMKMAPFSVRNSMARDDGQDWRPWCSPIKHQNSCGSCWAFAAAAILETSWRIYGKGPLYSLSDQQILDCSDAGSCSGGRTEVALDNLKKQKVVKQDCYPYDNRKNSACKNVNCDGAIVGNMYARGNGYPAGNEAQLEEWVKSYGPTSVYISAHDDLLNFRGGRVWNGPCANGINHAVNVVGFTSDYWIIRNSWGTGWGDRGYFNMKKGVGMCHIGEIYQLVQPE